MTPGAAHSRWSVSVGEATSVVRESPSPCLCILGIHLGCQLTLWRVAARLVHSSWLSADPKSKATVCVTAADLRDHTRGAAAQARALAGCRAGEAHPRRGVLHTLLAAKRQSTCTQPSHPSSLPHFRSLAASQCTVHIETCRPFVVTAPLTTVAGGWCTVRAERAPTGCVCIHGPCGGRASGGESGLWVGAGGGDHHRVPAGC